MKRFIALIFLASNAFASYSGYTYQKQISVNHLNVSTISLTYSNFPVLVSANDNILSTTTSSGGHLLNANGFDLVFSTMPDCSFLLNWDTETIQNVGISTMNVWVNLPSISSATDTVFYMCYGNSAITSYQGISTMTWNSGYQGVWHLGNGTGTFNGNDSTVNANNGVNTAVAAISTGVVDGAGSFNGTSSLLNVGNPTSLQITGNLTLSAYVNTAIGQEFTLGKTNGTTYDYAMYRNTSKGLTFFYNAGLSKSSVATIPDNAWTYETITVQGTTVSFYLNGVLDSTNTITAITNNNLTLKIGEQGSVGAFFFNGFMDEVRIQNVTESSGTIKTEFNNQKSPSTFLVISSEMENLPSKREVAISGGRVTIVGGKVTVR